MVRGLERQWWSSVRARHYFGGMRPTDRGLVVESSRGAAAVPRGMRGASSRSCAIMAARLAVSEGRRAGAELWQLVVRSAEGVAPGDTPWPRGILSTVASPSAACTCDGYSRDSGAVCMHRNLCSLNHKGFTLRKIHTFSATIARAPPTATSSSAALAAEFSHVALADYS